MKAFVKCASRKNRTPFRPRCNIYRLTLKGRDHEAAAYCEKLPADYRDKPECLRRALLRQAKNERGCAGLGGPLLSRKSWLSGLGLRAQSAAKRPKI